MPSLLHEAPLELLRRNPSSAQALLTGIPGVAIPKGGPASLAPGEVTASLPVELRADAVVLLQGSIGKLAVVAEVQMSARATTEANAELAMMAAWAGSTDLRDPAVQVRTLRLLAGLDAETLATYTRIVLIAAPDESSRRALEALMATVFKSEFVDKLEAEAEARGSARGEAMGLVHGQAVGRAQMILQVLAARHVPVPADIRDQVLSCTDIAQLDAWGSKAATAQTIEDVISGANGTS